MGFFKLLVYIPDLLKVASLIYDAIKEGKRELEIREGLEKMEKAFKEPDPSKKASDLDDIFNEKLN